MYMSHEVGSKNSNYENRISMSTHSFAGTGIDAEKYISVSFCKRGNRGLDISCKVKTQQELETLRSIAGFLDVGKGTARIDGLNFKVEKNSLVLSDESASFQFKIAIDLSDIDDLASVRDIFKSIRLPS